MIKILPAVCVSFPSSLHLLSVLSYRVPRRRFKGWFCFVGVSLGRGHDQTEECRTQSDGGEKPWDRRFNQTQIWSLLHSCDAQTSQTECLRVNATYRILFILNLSIIFKFTDSFPVSFWQSNVSTSTVQSSIYNQDISRKTFKKFDSETVWVWNLQFRQWTAGGAFEERNNNNGGKFRRNAGTLR